MENTTGYDIHYLPEGIFEVSSAAHKDLIVQYASISTAIDRLLALIQDSAP